MNTIRVNCPECHSSISVDKEKLLATQGHTVCPECLHTFKLVKKSKAEAAKADAAPTGGKTKAKAQAQTQTQTNQAAADNTKAAAKAKATAKSAEKPAAKPEKTARPAQKPLTYRIPKAETKARGFGEVGGDAFAFNLLDRDSISSQLPQVSVKPAARSLTHAPMHQEGQQNHITIHTDSLVFTLVGDGQAPMMPQSSMALAPMGAGLPVATQPPTVLPPQQVVVAASNEINWTIATIAALVVLIIQLFYLIMMLL